MYRPRTTDQNSRNFLGGLSCLLVSLGVLQAEISIDESSFLFRDELQRRHLWVSQEDFEAHDRLSTDSPELRERTRRFIEQYNYLYFYQPSERLFRELLKEGIAIRADGAAEPLFLSQLASMELQSGNVCKANRMLRQAYEHLVAQDYPDRCIYIAAIRLGRMTTRIEGADGMHEWSRKADKHLRPWLAAWTETERQSYVLEWLLEQQELIPDVRAQSHWVAALGENSKIHPWTLHCLRGNLHVERAWEARGTGRADTVTKEGWEAFRKELGLASEELTAAHSLHAELPYAPAKMISVMMGIGDNERRRAWFDLAIAAQADFADAYSNYMYSLLPRWGGSYQEMIAFGMECVQTARYDTEIPYQLIDAFSRIAGEQDVKVMRQILSPDEVYRTLADVLLRLAEDPSRAPGQNTRLPRMAILNDHLSVALLNGRSEEACKIASLLGKDDIDLPRLRQWRVDPLEELGRAFMLALTESELIDEVMNFDAEKLFTDDAMMNEWLPKFRQVRQDTTNYFAEVFLDKWIHAIEFEQQFQRGNWVALDFDAFASKWTLFRGQVNVVARSEIHCSDQAEDAGISLWSQNHFPAPLELKLRFSIIERCGDDVWVCLRYGDYPRQTEPTGRIFWVNPARKLAASQRSQHPATELPISEAAETELHVRIWNGHFQMLVNGELTHEQSDDTFKPSQSIEVLSKGMGSPMGVRFWPIQVRKMTEPSPANEVVEADR